MKQSNLHWSKLAHGGFWLCAWLSMASCLAACARSKAAPRREAQAGSGAQKEASRAKRRTSRSPLGTNLDPLADYSEDWISVDAFKRSREWISGTEKAFSDGRTLSLDEHGWVRSLLPGQVATTLMFWGGVRYPSGDYVVLYEGNGKLAFWPQDHVVSQKKGRVVLRIDSTKSGIGLTIKATDASDPIRDIRVLMPGGVCAQDPRRYCDEKTACGNGERCVPFEENYKTQIFHPRFLERLGHYSVLRFMDWMQTNGATIKHWQERPKPDDARWNKGAPVEVLVELANRQEQDPWFTLPHTADDTFITKFAEYVRDHLGAQRRVYIEHSNEVWNGAFPQAEYASQKGRERGYGPSAFEGQLAYHAERTVEIAKIWERVYGAKKSRLIRVLGSQAANPWGGEVMLARPGVKAHVDALAIAPYFGGYLGTPEHVERAAKLGLDGLFAELRERGLPEVREWIRANVETARKHKVRLIAYEGGQHLTGVGPGVEHAGLNALFDRANRDARMGQLYTEYLADWRKQGGQLFVHFTDCSGPSKWGRWGVLEWLEQARSEAPKYDAIVRFAETNARWW